MADISTVVSILPFKFISDKSTYGLVVEIPPASFDKPEVYHVTHQQASAYIDQDKGFMPVHYVSGVVAKSIVDDYVNFVLGVSNDARPGIFWIPEKYSVEEIKTKFKPLLEEAERLQRNWFSVLVTMADNDYSRTGNQRAVSDLQKFAAKYLALEREWLLDLSGEFIRCPYCTSQVKSAAAICPICRSVLKPEIMKGVQRVGA